MVDDDDGDFHNDPGGQDWEDTRRLITAVTAGAAGSRGDNDHNDNDDDGGSGGRWSCSTALQTAKEELILTIRSNLAKTLWVVAVVVGVKGVVATVSSS